MVCLTLQMNESHKMKLPRSADARADTVFSLAESLIDTEIWDGLQKPRLRSWIGMFNGSEERYFAAMLLNALIYRSQAQTAALALQLFQRRIPQLIDVLGLVMGKHPTLLEILSNPERDPNIRIVPILKESDPPTKSGPLVCRLLKRLLGLSDHWMIWPTQVNTNEHRHVSVFIFVDDFLGSGSQAASFFNQLKPQEPIHWIYAPFMACKSGIARLRNRSPHVSITAAEFLDDKHQLFHEASEYFSDGLNTPESAMSFYKQILQTRGIEPTHPYAFGYKKLQMAVSFSHATPNASLPLFWMHRQPLRPLFDR
jgi:hypothetical protein